MRILGWWVIKDRLHKTQLIIFCLSLLFIQSCASNSALTLLKASKSDPLVSPPQQDIDGEIRGRAIHLGGITLEPSSMQGNTDWVSERFLINLVEHQITKAFQNGGLGEGELPACQVHFSLTKVKFTEGRFLIPDPSILRMDMRLIDQESNELMKGSLESRYMSATVPVPVDGVIADVALPVKGRDITALTKMIPATVVAATVILDGLKQGRTLDEIKVYPDVLATGSIVVPHVFIRDNAYGLSELTGEDFGRAMAGTQSE